MLVIKSRRGHERDKVGTVSGTGRHRASLTNHPIQAIHTSTPSREWVDDLTHDHASTAFLSLLFSRHLCPSPQAGFLARTAHNSPPCLALLLAEPSETVLIVFHRKREPPLSTPLHPCR